MDEQTDSTRWWHRTWKRHSGDHDNQELPALGMNLLQVRTTVYKVEIAGP